METYLLEFIEAFTHLILYITNVYSYEYFEKRRKLNTLIWHCTNIQVEKYIQQALYPIKRILLNKSLYKYRITLKDLKNEVLNIFTIEFEQFYKTYAQFSYSSFEQFVWDFFTYIEMQIYEYYDTEKTFEISFDVLKDENDFSLNESLRDDWELISYDNLEVFDKKILKSMNISDGNVSNPICQIYVESRKSVN
ncbi:HORMA domain protein, putative [Plasmodium gallinaceum]|uniref:HORMA domain protein, putative n=1 Tax=Plasmodium gallinaceum TaxID=5849 RepID=A0A1J1GYB0_PLAGA|nr:HORMA domain protein, putative [Plasmodium gallinaceum]CRG97248.1 HORMA domain protein, putative [Plasmodium gallinaceum]